MDSVSTTLRALAAYQREHADFGYVVETPTILTPSEMAQRAAEVRQIASELESLADEAGRRAIAYDEFDVLRSRFRPLGKLPPGDLVSNVARAITAAEVVRLEQAAQSAL